MSCNAGLVLTSHRPFSEALLAKGVRAVVGAAPHPLAGELPRFTEVLGHAQHRAQHHHQHQDYLNQAEHHSLNNAAPRAGWPHAECGVYVHKCVTPTVQYIR